MANQNIDIKIQVDATQATQSTENYKKRLKELKDEMTKLQVETDGLSKASADQRKRFSELEQEAGKIADAMSDTAQRVKNLSDDYRGMTVAMEGIGGAVGGITAVQGALNLFGVESEQANESIKKMTSLMGILQGVQNVSKALNKDSALMTALMTAKNKLLTTSIQQQTTAQLALNAAKLGMVGAITAVVAAIGTLIYKYASAKSEVAKFNEELNKTASEAVAPTIVKVDELSAEWTKLGDNLEAKKKFVEENQKAFNDLGVSVNDVNDAENLLVTNTAAFIEAQTLRAKAEAARAKVEELVKEQLEDELEYERIFVDKQTTIWEDLATKFNPYVSEDTFKELHKQNQDRIDAEINKINEKANAYEASAKEKEKEAGITIVTADEVAKKQEEERKRQEAIKNAIAKKAEEERKYQELVKNNLSELKELNDALYSPDEEEQITEKYDKLLDLAIKYYGEESEQVKQITSLRLKALADLSKKRDDIARDEQRKAEDEAAKIEAVKLQTQLIALGKNSKAYFDKKQDIDRANELKELEELKRKYEDELITFEEYEATKDYITAEHAQARADILNEYANVVAEHQKQLDEEEQARTESRWQMAQSFVSAYSNFVNSAMEAELAAVGDNEAEQKRIRKKYARSQFISQIADIGVSTGQAIMGAWASASKLPYPANLILGTMMTALMTATGGAQIASATQQMDKAMQAARGGILGGQSHANGGTMLSNGVEAERGEAIINKRSTAAFAPLLSEINSYRGYGAPLISSAPSTGSLLQPTVSDEAIQRIVSATVQGVASIPVVVSEARIEDSIRNVSITRERSFI